MHPVAAIFRVRTTRRTAGLTMIIIALMLTGWLAPQADRVRADDSEPVRIPHDRTAEAIRGSWDFSKSPYRYVALLTLRQPDNRFPSYWAGRNTGKQLTLDPQVDLLADALRVEMEGAIAVRLTRAPDQPGTVDRQPAGQWAGQLEDHPVVFRITELNNLQAVDTWEEKEDRGLVVTADWTGTLAVGERTAPISGEARFRFSERQPRFSVTFQATLEDQAMRLAGPGGNGEPIQMTLYTRSVASDQQPEPTLDAPDLDLDLAD